MPAHKFTVGQKIAFRPEMGQVANRGGVLNPRTAAPMAHINAARSAILKSGLPTSKRDYTREPRMSEGGPVRRDL